MHQFMPHGHCYLWEPTLVWTMAASDTLIGLSYLTISVLLWIFVRSIRLPFSRMFLAFGVFILACGAGHLIDVLTIWIPAYWATATIRVITAVASVATAISFFPVKEGVRKVVDRSRSAYLELVNTVDGIVWESEVGKPGYTFISRQAEKILGYPIERWTTEPRFWQSILHPDDRERMTGEGYLQPQDKIDSQLEYRVLTTAGKTLWVRDYIKVIREKGKAIKMRGIMVDITERKEAEVELRQARAAAETAAGVKSQFLANMSHEIRTPLNAIVGMASVGLDSRSEVEWKDCLSTIKTAADSLLLIVNEILDHSKIEAGKMELEVSDFRLSTIWENALEVAAPLARSKGLELGSEISANLPEELRGDPGRLSQVLLNLLSNAIKFTPAPGRVTLKLSAHDRRIRFEIGDTGPGIPQETREKLFLPFSQADASMTRRFGGTGLGLSICKRLVALMGGEIGVESAPETGSIFWFEIPQVAASASVPEHEDDQWQRVASSPNPLKVLVADDNLANQKVILRMLEKLGHVADAVANGEEAVISFGQKAYDLILMDCQMPEMDGYEATRRIRAIERGSEKRAIPILALTAHAMSGDRQKCEAAGMDGYLSKPVTMRQLKEALAGHENSGTRESIPPQRLDHAYLQQLETLQSPGQPDLICELIDYFLTTVPEALGKVRRAIEDHDTKTLEVVGHQLKSTCHNVGARRLAKLFEAVENQSSGELGDELNQAAGNLAPEFEAVSAELLEIRGRRASI